MSDQAMIWLFGMALGTAAAGPVLMRIRRRERETDAAEARALEYGLNEPASLHPIVDPLRCIGSGSCVDACANIAASSTSARSPGVISTAPSVIRSIRFGSVIAATVRCSASRPSSSRSPAITSP